MIKDILLFMKYYSLGIILTYFILNSCFAEYHALDSNIIKKEIIEIGNKKFKLQPFLV
jgi:hypothetical protein